MQFIKIRRKLWGVAMILTVMLGQSEVKAKDFGTQGQVFKIEEQDMLEMIISKLGEMSENGLLAAKQNEVEEKARRFIMRPKLVDGITRAVKGRKWDFDPSYVAPHDIKDHEGKIICTAGTIINPLETVPFGRAMFFIDGDSQDQIDWVMNEIKNLKQDHTIILVNGEPMELMKKYKMRFYFDQSGSLTSRFGIAHVPAIVAQKSLQLQVEEIVLK